MARWARWAVGSIVLWLAAVCSAQPPAMTLQVDATEAPRHVFHSRLSISVNPGPLALYFPKWIPGDHAPAGWINGLAGLKLTASGNAVPWRRDPVDMYAFHCDVPAGTQTLEVSLDFLSPLEQMFFTTGGTENLIDINWESLLLYPATTRPAELTVAATLRLPPGWKFASALAVHKQLEDSVAFEPVSLATLVDSPLIAGCYFKQIPLTTDGPLHELDIVADSDAAMRMPPEMMQALRNLPPEMYALFRSRHYRAYRFLLTLSDPLGTDGLEHHECSDNRVWERYLTDENARYTIGYLLPHEFIHSWNGKYRRPTGLATTDFQQPMNDELLWVYEGLTHYLCYMMAARAGFETPQQAREMIAYFAARLEHTPGRTWRPLIDTAVAAQLLYDQPAEGAAWRRGVDYYNEGMLIWLDADVTIRRQTNGQKSLDDFCRLFFGGQSGAPSLKTYTRQDVQAALDSICHADWQEFFDKRIYRINEHIPLDGITNGGWQFVYDDTPNQYQTATEATRSIFDTTFSIGLRIGQGGKVVDIVPGSPADKAGLPAGSTLLSVNGRKYSEALLREAIDRSSNDSAMIDLLAENQEFSKVYHIGHHGGARYPHLRRDETAPDLMSQIMAPLRPIAASTADSSNAAPSVTEVEKQDGWKLLFDGVTTAGWRGLGMDGAFPHDRWEVRDHCLYCKGGPGRTTDLITTGKYENFELSFQWLCPKPPGNSGVKYRVQEKKGDGFAFGPEYQIMYDPGVDDKHATGSLYDCLRPRGKTLRQPEEFNDSRIVVGGDHVEHWLNGVKVVEFDFGSDALKAAVEQSKFRNTAWAKDPLGYIALQDHHEQVLFRNIKLRELTAR